MANVPNIIVLVSGTTDPTNSNLQGRSASYSSPKPNRTSSEPKFIDPDYYWQENIGFRTAIDALKQRYTNLHIFTAHGWTGDNRAANRGIVGAYLANRLCGADKETAYYKGFLEQEVAFHFIGHSHGGNVINELTKRAATVWPSQWKIHSITYLSTPFFTKLHQVDTRALHSNCKIINVFNKYDLTQRVIADFSLLPFHDALSTAGTSGLVEKLQGIRFDSQVLQDALMSTRLKDTDKSWKMKPKAFMDPAKAQKLYDHCIQALEKCKNVFATARGIVEKLNKEITFPVAVELEKQVTHKRKILSDALARRFKQELSNVEAGLGPTLQAFKDRRKSGVYPVGGFFDDLYISKFLKSLTQFLKVDANTLSGPLCDLLADTLKEQIEKFDDTTASPQAQFAKTPFAKRIVEVDVTKEDDYHQFQRGVVFNRLIERLEKAEQRYAKVESSTNLMDLIFTLLANHGPVHTLITEWSQTVSKVRSTLAWVNKYTDIPLVSALTDLCAVIETYAGILQARTAGQLEASLLPFSMPLLYPQKQSSTPIPYQPSKAPPFPYGSLNYFMRVSHSVSRQTLYSEVRTVLEGQITCKKR
jgi:hypothetical protein